MKPARLHPRVYDDIDEALAYTREQFGPRQVILYARLIAKGRKTLRSHPTIGQLREDLGPGIRVYCIAAGQSGRRMVTSIGLTKMGPSTSRASFTLPAICRTSP